jgi:hypothetical protein
MLAGVSAYTCAEAALTLFSIHVLSLLRRCLIVTH